jgi:hypothetical protein
MYDFERDAMVTAPELMLVHGLPSPDLDLSMFSNASLMVAVGESMSAASIGTVMLAIYLNELAPWFTEQRSARRA